MNLLKFITDKDILGTEGLSDAKPRLTARAILKNGSQYAVLYSEKFDLYSLPGGGVEEDEDIIEALKREIWEETGCECNEIKPLGFVEENRAYCNYTQLSYYFVVNTYTRVFKPNFTETEIQNKTVIDWYSLEEAYRLIAGTKHTSIQRMYLQARDVTALDAYQRQYAK